MCDSGGFVLQGTAKSARPQRFQRQPAFATVDRMPTSVTIGAFVLAAVLLLVGLVGGRFKLFGAEVSGEAGRAGRILAECSASRFSYLPCQALRPSTPGAAQVRRGAPSQRSLLQLITRSRLPRISGPVVRQVGRRPRNVSACWGSSSKRILLSNL